MSDRDLLELAAKAAGMDVSWHNEDEADYYATNEGIFLNGKRSPDNSKYWNPLTDDGDALRLAVKLRLEVVVQERYIWANTTSGPFPPPREDATPDPYAATRRCIVRAAAAIGSESA
jgi:hypothetical protein